MFGPSKRLATFLHSLLKRASRDRYHRALERFDAHLVSHALPFRDLNEEEQDFVLAEWVLDMMDVGESPQLCADTIAALQKEYAGRRRFKAASAAVEGWKRGLPTHMAAPMPQEVCLALVTVLFTSGRREVPSFSCCASPAC